MHGYERIMNGNARPDGLQAYLLVWYSQIIFQEGSFHCTIDGIMCVTQCAVIIKKKVIEARHHVKIQLPVFCYRPKLFSLAISLIVFSAKPWRVSIPVIKLVLCST